MPPRAALLSSPQDYFNNRQGSSCSFLPNLGLGPIQYFPLCFHLPQWALHWQATPTSPGVPLPSAPQRPCVPTCGAHKEECHQLMRAHLTRWFPWPCSLWNTRRSVPRTRKWTGEAGRLKGLPATMGGPKSRVLKSCHRTQNLISDFPVCAPKPSEVSKEYHVGGGCWS